MGSNIISCQSPNHDEVHQDEVDFPPCGHLVLHRLNRGRSVVSSQDDGIGEQAVLLALYQLGDDLAVDGRVVLTLQRKSHSKFSFTIQHTQPVSSPLSAGGWE